MGGMSRTTRLFSLIQALRRRSRPVTAAALAEELGVSERTLYRDIAELTAQGAAIRSQAKLRIDYADGAGARTRRVVWPLALGLMNEARILVAWCEWRQGYRHFRTDRIAAAEDARERYPGRRSALLRTWRAEIEGEFTADRG